MTITTTYYGKPTATAVSVDHKRFVTNTLLERGERVSGANGTTTRVREWVINPTSEYQAVLSIQHRFDSKANKGVGRTDVTIRIDSWIVTDNDGLVLTAEPVSVHTGFSFVGQSLNDAAQLLTLLLGVHGISYTLDTATPEEEQIVWLAAGGLKFYTE